MFQEQMSEKQFKEFYNEKSSDVYRKFVYHLKEQLEGVVLKDKVILEVGCGKGFVSLWLALFGEVKKIVALDESEGVGSEKDILNSLEGTVKDLKIKNIQLVKSDITKNLFEDNSFDVIIANNALHHVVRTGSNILNDSVTKDEWVKLFRELRRLLRPDGILVVAEFSRNNIWRYAPMKLRFKEIEWSIHLTLKEWFFVIKLAAFREISFKYVIPYKLRSFERVLSNFLGSFLLNSSFNIFARK